MPQWVAGPLIELPVRIVAQGARSEFLRVALAEKYRPCILQPSHCEGVLRRHAVHEEARASRRAHASGVYDVLDAVGNAVQRTLPSPSRDVLPRPLSLLPGFLGHHTDEAQHSGVDCLNALETRLDDMERGQLLLFDALRDLVDRRIAEIIRQFVSSPAR